MARAGRHRESPSGSQVQHRIDDHAAPHRVRPGQRELYRIGGEPGAETSERASDHGARKSPQRGRAGQRHRETEVDPVEHREAGEDAADDRPPSRSSRGGCAVGVVACLHEGGERCQPERESARERERRELQCRHHEHHAQQDRGGGHPPAPPADDRRGTHRGADELCEPDEALDEDAHAEDLVDRGEHPQAPGSVQVQEVLIRNRAVQDPVGKDEHEALFHRGAGAAQHRAQREDERNRGHHRDRGPILSGPGR